MKKRNKAYRPKLALIPKIIPRITASQAYPDLALHFHMMLEVAIREPAIVTINQLSKQLCVIAGAMSYESSCKPLLGRTDMAALAIMSAIKVLESIVERHTLTGKVFVSGLEGKSLYAASNGIDSVLTNISKNSYEIALFEVEGFIKEQIERVAA